MNRTGQQEPPVLAALRAALLDRIRLMKTLFRFGTEKGARGSGPLIFQAYLYGPCAFELYSTLARLVRHGLIAQAPQEVLEVVRERELLNPCLIVLEDPQGPHSGPYPASPGKVMPTISAG